MPLHTTDSSARDIAFLQKLLPQHVQYQWCEYALPAAELHQCNMCCREMLQQVKLSAVNEHEHESVSMQNFTRGGRKAFCALGVGLHCTPGDAGR